MRQKHINVHKTRNNNTYMSIISWVHWGRRPTEDAIINVINWQTNEPIDFRIFELPRHARTNEPIGNVDVTLIGWRNGFWYWS